MPSPTHVKRVNTKEHWPTAVLVPGLDMLVDIKFQLKISHLTMVGIFNKNLTICFHLKAEDEFGHF